jgi:hypothetical protein
VAPGVDVGWASTRLPFIPSSRPALGREGDPGVAWGGAAAVDGINQLEAALGAAE